MLALLMLVAQCKVPSPPTDIVVFIADDMGVDDLAETSTPHLDAMAADGLTFTRAYSHPICSPTRRSLHYGRWQRNHHRAACNDMIPDSPHPLALPLPDLQNSLPFKMPVPMHLVGKFHVCRANGQPWGYSALEDGYTSWTAGSPASVSACVGTSYTNWKRADNGPVVTESTYATTAQKDAAINLLLQRATGSRILVVSFNAPHIPIHTPPASALPPGYSVPSTPRGQYKAAIAAVDHAIGEILQFVRPGAYVFFVGDNGTPVEGLPIGSQDADRVKKSTFERGINIPMIVTGPRVPRGTSCDEIVHLMDLHDTLLELVGAAPSGPDAVSFVSLMMNPNGAPVRDWLFSGHVNPLFGDNDQAIVTKTHKFRRDQGVEELYDLVNDPDEQSPLDLSDHANAALADQLRAILDGI